MSKPKPGDLVTLDVRGVRPAQSVAFLRDLYEHWPVQLPPAAMVVRYHDAKHVIVTAACAVCLVESESRAYVGPKERQEAVDSALSLALISGFQLDGQQWVCASCAEPPL